MTYAGSPSSSATQAVRFLVGDTSTSTALVEDAEIAWALSQENSNQYGAAALVCESLEAQWAQKSDTAVGDLSKKYSQVSDRYGVMAKRLRQRQLTRGVSPFVGGISESQKDSIESNTDIVPPFFTRTLHDNTAST